MGEPDETRELSDDEWVSRIGARRGLLFAFRGDDETYVSVTLGKLTVDEAVGRSFLREANKRDCVGHARIGSLREAGFQVRHAPTEDNPDHAAIEFSGEWTDDVFERLLGCFGNPVFKE